MTHPPRKQSVLFPLDLNVPLCFASGNIEGFWETKLTVSLGASHEVLNSNCTSGLSGLHTHVYWFVLILCQVYKRSDSFHLIFLLILHKINGNSSEWSTCTFSYYWQENIQHNLEITVHKNVRLTCDNTNTKAMSCPLNSITHCKSMTLVTSQGAIQAVIIQSYIIYEHGGFNLGFIICKLSAKGLN